MKKEEQQPYLIEEMRPKPAAPLPIRPPWERGNQYKRRTDGTAWRARLEWKRRAEFVADALIADRKGK